MERERGDFTRVKLLFLSVKQCNRTHDIYYLKAGFRSLKNSGSKGFS